MDQLSFWIRWLHVVSMAAVLGGAVLLWALAFGASDSSADPPAPLLMAAAARYEAVYSLAAGVLVVTGIGNLGGFGTGPPAPTSAWGHILTAKLWAVLLFLILSLIRTLLVVRLDRAPSTGRVVAGRRVWQGLYGTTSLLAIAIFTLALALTHG